MRIIIATGGTGGHIFPGLAIAEELEKRNARVTIVGSRFGMERRIIKERYPLELTWQKPLLGRNAREKLMFPLFLKISLLQSLYILMKEHPNAVLGTGGFGSFSIVFAAALLGIPTMITEIDSAPGLTTRILSRFVFEVWLAFDKARNGLPTRNVKTAGIPVRREITKKTLTIHDFGLKDGKPTILVFGGSRGARKINETLKITTRLVPEFQFIWQTGESMEPVNYPNVWASKFIDDMGSAYGNAELVISRAGALTIGELAAVGLPSILIPYPHATGKHQEMNARALERSGAAVVILEKDLTPSILADTLKRIIGDRGLRMRMSSRAREFGSQDTAELIAKRMIEICDRSRKQISKPK